MQKDYSPLDAGRRTESALKTNSSNTFRNRRRALIHLHETLLFPPTYPQSPIVVRLSDAVLFDFGRRVRRVPSGELAGIRICRSSGVAGTGLTTNFSYVFTKSLAERHAAKTPREAKRSEAQSNKTGSLKIDWQRFEHVDRLAPILALSDSRKHGSLGRRPPRRLAKMFRVARGDIHWLWNTRVPEVYDLLEIPLRFE